MMNYLVALGSLKLMALRCTYFWSGGYFFPNSLKSIMPITDFFGGQAAAPDGGLEQVIRITHVVDVRWIPINAYATVLRLWYRV